MSFSFDFNAINSITALAVLEKQHAPEIVKGFARAALSGITGPVSVRANGHLYNNDYNVSSCTISVAPIVYTDVVENPEKAHGVPTNYISPRAG
jgi:hypothetical protein